jgi:hypothetical protein
VGTEIDNFSAILSCESSMELKSSTSTGGAEDFGFNGSCSLSCIGPSFPTILDAHCFGLDSIARLSRRQLLRPSLGF